MAHQRNVAVIGAGGWGTAIALVLAKKGHSVTQWVRREDYRQHLLKTRENTDYLPGILLPANIHFTNSLAEATKGSELVVLATPTKALRDTVNNIKPHLNDKSILVSLSKGLERDSFLRCSQVIQEEVSNPVVVLSGPNHAEEVARDIPTATVVSSDSLEVAETVQEIFMTPKFRVYTNPDLVGVEIGGALKNIIALAAGITDGLGFGDNTKSALMTRGIAEIARLGISLGAESLTFAGLAGIGDLIATCTSKHSRNWRTGYALGKGETLESILERTGMVVEGVTTTEVAASLAQKLDVNMPITVALYDVLFNNRPPHLAVTDLMLRSKTNEMEEIVASINK